MKKFVAIGLMSGTSMDGIDTSIVETDGITLQRTGVEFIHSYSPDTIKKLKQNQFNSLSFNEEAFEYTQLNKLITNDHIEAVNLIKNRTSLKPNLIGFHGQTILHMPEKKISIQLGDGALLSNETKIKVVSDFRNNDIENGGQGAPLAPIYHKTILKEIKTKLPSCMINIGGVTNLTYYDGKNLIGFDTGPGNGLIDWYMNKKLRLPFDKGGVMAFSGSSNKKILNEIMDSQFFKSLPPKSIDKLSLKKMLEELNIFNIEIQDAISTITEITIASIINSFKFLPKNINKIIIVGGGQHNDYIVKNLQERCNIEVVIGNKIGLPGDFIEAELMAFLAARHMNDLPITFPDTTGVKEPLFAGILYNPLIT